MSDDMQENIAQDEQPTNAPQQQPVASVKDTPEYKALLQESIERRQEIKALKAQIAELQKVSQEPTTPTIKPEDITAAVLKKLEERQAQQQAYDKAISGILTEYKLPDALLSALKAAGSVEAAKEVAKGLVSSGRFDHVSTGASDNKEAAVARLNKRLGLT